MVTVGIDLSTDPRKTGLSRIRWRGGRAEVDLLSLGWQLDGLATEVEKSDWAAIDAPFGWPDRFILTIEAWARTGRWPEVGREKLRFRLTDDRVRKTKIPLSVSSDRIASTAMLCAELLESLSKKPRWGRPIDRAGADRVVECYPAAALTKWGLIIKEYKGTAPKNRAARETILSTLAPAGGWLVLSAAQRGCCIERDDYLDALVCGLVARAVARGLVDEPLPEAEHLDQIRREGWIYLPAEGSLSVLV